MIHPIVPAKALCRTSALPIAIPASIATSGGYISAIILTDLDNGQNTGLLETILS